MTSTAETGEPLTIDDLARRVQLPVRTIREYHTMRLLPPPERQGRLGLYGDRHVERLRLITRAAAPRLLPGRDPRPARGVGERNGPGDPARRRREPGCAGRDAAVPDPGGAAPAAACPGRGHARPGPAGSGWCARTATTSACGAPRCSAWWPTGSELGVPPGEALDLIEVLVGDLDTLAGKLAEEIVDAHLGAAVGRGPGRELSDLLRRGRFLLLQGAASTLADRIGAALAERAGTARDGGQLLAVLDEIRVGAVADAAGTIHRVGGDR